MSPIITPDILAHIMPAAPIVWVDALNTAAGRFKIDTPDRLAMWLAHVAHESTGLTVLTESLHYRDPARIAKMFRTGFDLDHDRVVDPEEIEFARAYVGKPEKLASRAYANRNGNGPEESGDGWRYRGRGPIQITGAANYAACGKAIGLPLLNEPDLLLQPGPGALSAGWFWSSRGLNADADSGDITHCTKLINGGLNGLDDRTRLWTRARKALGTA